MIQRTEMRHHVKNICANRIITCHFCQKEMTYYHYKQVGPNALGKASFFERFSQAHKEKYCDKLAVKCPLCSQEMLRERVRKQVSLSNVKAIKFQLKIHCGKGIKGDCPKVEIQCKFSHVGCPVKVK